MNSVNQTKGKWYHDLWPFGTCHTRWAVFTFFLHSFLKFKNYKKKCCSEWKYAPIDTWWLYVGWSLDLTQKRNKAGKMIWWRNSHNSTLWWYHTLSIRNNVHFEIKMFKILRSLNLKKLLWKLWKTRRSVKKICFIYICVCTYLDETSRNKGRSTDKHKVFSIPIRFWIGVLI